MSQFWQQLSRTGCFVTEVTRFLDSKLYRVLDFQPGRICTSRPKIGLDMGNSDLIGLRSNKG